MNQKMIPFRFLLRFFWLTIPETIPKTVKESELQFFWNRNRHSPTSWGFLSTKRRRVVSLEWCCSIRENGSCGVRQAKIELSKAIRTKEGETSGLGIGLARGRPFMTSAKFLGFWTPSPLVRKFTQPPLLSSGTMLLGQPPSPLGVDVLF